MKRYLNYVLILANVLSFIGIVISLGLFIHWKNQLIDDGGGEITQLELVKKMQILVIVPVLSMVFSCLMLGYYIWNVNFLIKNNEDDFNKKTFIRIKNIAFLSIINYSLTGILGIIGCLAFLYDWTARIGTFATGCGFSGIFGLIIIGFISYFNLQISFQEAKTNGTWTKPDKDVESKQSSQSHKIDDRATSGSF